MILLKKNETKTTHMHFSAARNHQAFSEDPEGPEGSSLTSDVVVVYVCLLAVAVNPLHAARKTASYQSDVIEPMAVKEELKC